MKINFSKARSLLVILFLKIRLILSKNKISVQPSSILKRPRIHIKGHNNSLVITKNCKLFDVSIVIHGSNNDIYLSDGVEFRGASTLYIEGDHCVLSIGSRSTFEGAHIAVTEDRSRVDIGEDCMFAKHVELRTGDSHSVLDSESGRRLNIAGNIIKGEHVWVASRAIILKGTRIPANCIVAAGGIVTKPFVEEGLISRP